jgi:hypothetical protein
MPDAIASEADSLRLAVEACDFPAAEAAAARYGALLTQLPPAEALPLLEDACRLIDWARGSLSAARSRLLCASEYAGVAAVHSWRVDV